MTELIIRADFREAPLDPAETGTELWEAQRAAFPFEVYEFSDCLLTVTDTDESYPVDLDDDYYTADDFAEVLNTAVDVLAAGLGMTAHGIGDNHWQLEPLPKMVRYVGMRYRSVDGSTRDWVIRPAANPARERWLRGDGDTEPEVLARQMGGRLVSSEYQADTGTWYYFDLPDGVA